MAALKGQVLQSRKRSIDKGSKDWSLAVLVPTKQLMREVSKDGAIRGAQARAIDFDDPANNDWLAVNQFSVTENKHPRRPDVVLFVNGLAVAVRVNRVFKDKPGGLVVDYLGLAHELKAALATYTEIGGTGRTALDQEEAVAVMLEKYEVCCGLFHGFDRSR
jgi:type I site-specific restriction-modification system R (restriction) subunit